MVRIRGTGGLDVDRGRSSRGTNSDEIRASGSCTSGSDTMPKTEALPDCVHDHFDRFFSDRLRSPHATSSHYVSPTQASFGDATLSHASQLHSFLPPQTSSIHQPIIPIIPSTSGAHQPIIPTNSISHQPIIPTSISHPTDCRSSPIEDSQQHTLSTESRSPQISSSSRGGSRLPLLPWDDAKRDFAKDCGSFVSTSLRHIIKSKQDPSGHTWKGVTRHTRELYWEAFKKAWTWDEAITSLVRIAFEKKIAKRYGNIMCNIRSNWLKDGTIPIGMDSVVWDAWTTAWSSEEFLAQHERNATNRRRGIQGGRAESTHTGGSVPHATTLRNMREEAEGETPSSYDLFVRTHRVRKSSENKDLWTSEKCRDINDIYNRYVVNHHGELTEVDKNKYYLEAVRSYEKGKPAARKKKRVFGIGSATQDYFADLLAPQPPYSSPSELETMWEDISRLRDQSRDLKARLEQVSSQFHEMTMLRENLRRLEEQMNKMIEYIRQYPRPQPPS